MVAERRRQEERHAVQIETAARLTGPGPLGGTPSDVLEVETRACDQREWRDRRHLQRPGPEVDVRRGGLHVQAVESSIPAQLEVQSRAVELRPRAVAGGTRHTVSPTERGDSRCWGTEHEKDPARYHEGQADYRYCPASSHTPSSLSFAPNYRRRSSNRPSVTPPSQSFPRYPPM